MIALAMVFANMALIENAHAGASAKLTWTPPATNADSTPLTDLAGYKIYYNTVSTWLNHVAACAGLGGITIDVPLGDPNLITVGSEVTYTIIDTLTPGRHYYFAVAAYDDESTPNISTCATGDGGVTEVDKVLSYTSDSNYDGDVSMTDFTFFRANWGNTACTNVSNFIGKSSNCAVNMSDFNVLRNDFNDPDLF